MCKKVGKFMTRVFYKYSVDKSPTEDYIQEFSHKKIKMVTGVISPGVFKYGTDLRGISGML